MRFRLFNVIFGLAVLAFFTISFTIFPMTLERKIEITDEITIVALVLTLVAAVFAFYFKNQQAALLKNQRQKDVLMIAQAKDGAEHAKQEAEIAKKDAAVAYEKAAISNEKAAQAELKSRALELELLRLKLSVSDRSLPSFIKAELANSLRKFAPKTIMIICQVSNSKEPLDFSNDLGAFFKEIGWNSEVQDSHNVMLPPRTGVRILSFGKENTEIATILQKELSDIGFKCEAFAAQEVGDEIVVQVFAK